MSIETPVQKYSVLRKHLGWIAYFGFAILFIGFLCNLLSIGQSQWQPIQSPAPFVVELLPTYRNSFHIQVRTDDENTYGAYVNSSDSGRVGIGGWVKLDAPMVKEDQQVSACSVEQLPDSLIPSRPNGLQQCTRFVLEPEASSSYIALDGKRQLWRWVSDDYTWGLSIICMPLWLLALLFIPTLPHLPKSHILAVLSDPQS